MQLIGRDIVDVIDDVMLSRRIRITRDSSTDNVTAVLNANRHPPTVTDNMQVNNVGIVKVWT